MNVPFFNLLASISNSLFNIFRERRRESRERNDRIAALCDGIAFCLEKIASDLRAGHISRSLCVELAHYLTEFQDTVGKDLDENKAAALREHLRSAQAGPFRSVRYREELRFRLKPTAPASAAEFENDLNQIEEAVGSFRANANLLRGKV